MIAAGDKVLICNNIIPSHDWKFICSEIDLLIAKMDRLQTDYLNEGKINEALRTAGMKAGFEAVKNLPIKVRRDNLGIIENIKERFSGLRSGEIKTEAN